MDKAEYIDYSQFLKEYLTDANEGFQAVNNALILLEKDHSQTRLLDEVFRGIHTLKSSSAMIGFSDIANLSHTSEDLLDHMRKNEVPVNKETVDLVFTIVDTLEKMVAEVAEKKSEKGYRSMYAAQAEELKQAIADIEARELLFMQGVITINEKGIIESFNQPSERLFGYSAEEVIGKNVNILMPEPYKSRHNGYIADYLKTGKGKVIGRGMEVLGLRKDGSTFSMELAVNEIKLPERRIFVGLLRDTTNKKAKKETARPVEKTKTVKVSAEILDSLFNLSGELIIIKNRISNLVADIAGKELNVVMATLERTINTMQENISAARMVPVDEIFQRFPRLVRDIAREKNREIEFNMLGSEIELDKAIIDAIGEPIMHLLRNAIDHGIEPAEERKTQGKPKAGGVRLSAKRAENHILIEVEDDGYGIDMERMKEIGVKKGFIRPEDIEKTDEREIINLLFKPGFSSAEKVTDVSGRGVGLDVVKTVVEKLGGIVDVSTQKGKGSRFTLRLPLATSIVQTLMIDVGGHTFAIPSDIVIETLEVKPEFIKEIKDRQVLILRNSAIPFIELGSALNIHAQKRAENHTAVIISRGDKSFALGVDAVLDQTENIIKPFDPIAQGFTGFSGGTILGDGSVVLLLDIPRLLEIKTI